MLKSRKIMLLIADIILLCLSYLFALWFRLDIIQSQGFNIDDQYMQVFISNILILLVIKIIVLWLMNMYNSLWEYAGIEELLQLCTASIFANTTAMGYFMITQHAFPRSVYIIVTVVDIILLGGVRFFYRFLRRVLSGKFTIKKRNKRVLIIGAGDAGAMLVKEIKSQPHSDMKVIGLLDDAQHMWGNRINGKPILGNVDGVKEICNKRKIDEIIISIPTLNEKEKKEIIDKCNHTGCSVKIVPKLSELIDGKVSIASIRPVEIADLLGRKERNLDNEVIMNKISGQTIMITGGGGSIGSELCRQICLYNPRKLIIVDIYENNAYNILNELNRKYNKDSKSLDVEAVIASVRDFDRMSYLVKTYQPDMIFHAAAHKHVPLMESSPSEAVKNNVKGTHNMAVIADQYNVPDFVLISTDKAVNPTNVMGATKRFCEMIIQSLNEKSKTRYVAVRFGNVLGSNGSVIPLFKKQIANGGPVTITHRDIIRYFMTIPEAAQLVLQASTLARGGEIFILDMGEPVKIVDLAEKLISLSGFRPYDDIDIKTIGLRPGEKLYEELLLEEEGLKNTIYDGIFIGKPAALDFDEITNKVNQILTVAQANNAQQIKSTLSDMIPTYSRCKRGEI